MASSRAVQTEDDTFKVLFSSSAHAANTGQVPCFHFKPSPGHLLCNAPSTPCYPYAMGAPHWLVFLLLSASPLPDVQFTQPDILNVRAAPEDKAPVAFRLRVQTAVVVVERTATHARIVVQGRGDLAGWVRADLLGEPVTANDLLERARAAPPDGRMPLLERAVALAPDLGEAWRMLAERHGEAGRKKEQAAAEAAARGEAPFWVARCEAGQEGLVLAAWDPAKGFSWAGGPPESLANRQRLARELAAAAWMHLNGRASRWLPGTPFATADARSENLGEVNIMLGPCPVTGLLATAGMQALGEASPGEDITAVVRRELADQEKMRTAGRRPLDGYVIPAITGVQARRYDDDLVETVVHVGPPSPAYAGGAAAWSLRRGKKLLASFGRTSKDAWGGDIVETEPLGAFHIVARPLLRVFVVRFRTGKFESGEDSGFHFVTVDEKDRAVTSTIIPWQSGC